MALGDRGEVSVLLEGALGWPMLADMIEEVGFDELGHNQKETEMVELEVHIIPFVQLFATRVWLQEDSLSMPSGMVEAEGGRRKAALAFGCFTIMISAVYVQVL